MDASRLGASLVKIASVYMVAGLAGGMYVALSGRFAFISVHSHVSLLGWATMAITGLVYEAFPSCARSALSRVHFWLHNVGLPIMLISLIFHAAGEARAEPLVGLGSTLVLIALSVFAVNILRNAASPARQG